MKRLTRKTAEGLTVNGTQPEVYQRLCDVEDWIEEHSYLIPPITERSGRKLIRAIETLIAPWRDE